METVITYDMVPLYEIAVHGNLHVHVQLQVSGVDGEAEERQTQGAVEALLLVEVGDAVQEEHDIHVSLRDPEYARGRGNP